MGVIKLLDIFLFLVMVVGVLAYILGRQIGKAQGIRLGETATILRIREQCLLTGHCPLCESNQQESAGSTGK